MFPNCYQISINFNFFKNSRKTNFLKNIEILIFRILNDVKNVFYVSKVDKFLTKILVSGTGVPNGIYRISFKFWINFFSLNLILLKVFEFGYSENILFLRLSGLFVFQKSSPRFLGTMIPWKILKSLKKTKKILFKYFGGSKGRWFRFLWIWSYCQLALYNWKPG